VEVGQLTYGIGSAPGSTVGCNGETAMTEGSGRPPAGVSRRQLVGGIGAAGFGGLIAGGAGGFLVGRSGDDEAATDDRKAPLKIGALIPVTGYAAADGREMLRGLKLGVADVNRNGGVGGRRLEVSLLDAKDQTPEIMTSAMRKFVAEQVAAVFSPYITYTNVETPIVGRAGTPTFHVNTFQGNVDFAVKKGFKNIFQTCPSEIWYAQGFIDVMTGLVKAGKFTPRDKTVAIVSSNDAYSISISRTFRRNLEKFGWRVVQFDTYTVPQNEWGAVLTRIRKNDPDVVFHSDYLVGDEASFIKQFAQAPTRSLVYQQYAPSVPEYLELAGGAANGVLWATASGTITDDDLGKRFVQLYREAYDAEPGFSIAGLEFDAVHLWALAAGVASDPMNFDEVGDNVRTMVVRGVNGGYKLGPDQQVNMPYPAFTKDPSLGAPLLTFQIQDGKQVLISPDPYPNGEFQPPSWLA
jgi:branched-chain amino acid transport system substrate-binding protein